MNWKSKSIVLEFKYLSKFPPVSATKLGPTKIEFSGFFFAKCEIDVSVTNFCVQEVTSITETKTEQVEPSKKLFFGLFQFPSNCSEN